MKLTRDDVNGIYILSAFVSGIVLIILSKTLIIDELVFVIGLGLLSTSMIISIMEVVMNKK
jgi:hypothetical protein